MAVHEHFGEIDVRLRQALDYDDSAGTPSSTRAGMLWVPASGKWAPRDVLLASDYGVASGVAGLDATGAVPAGNLPVGTGAAQVAAGNHAHNSAYVDFSSAQSVGGVKTFTTGVRLPAGDTNAAAPIRTDRIGAASGVAGLDANSDIPLANLPSHAATHATAGVDPLAPADIGAVPTSQRGPIGGVQAQTLPAGAYAIDASSPNARRFTLTGDITLNVPTNGTDHQRIVFWFGASGATRVVTFVSGYEVSPLVPSRTISIASGAWEMVEVENRNGTWRLVQTDQLLFSAADVGGDGRYSRGVLGRNRRTTTTAASSSTTEVNVSRTSAPVVTGRLYRVKATPLMFAPNAALTAYALAVATLRITTDGSVPTSTSTLLGQVHTGLPSGLPLGQPVGGYCEALWTSTVTGTLSALLSFYRGAGAAGIAITAAAGYPIDLQIEDLGVDPGSTGAIY